MAQAATESSEGVLNAGDRLTAQTLGKRVAKLARKFEGKHED
jgi:hypothetical protein